VVGTSSWRQGKRNGMKNCWRVDLEGDNDWTTKKIKDNLKTNKPKKKKKDKLMDISNIFCQMWKTGKFI
jgi:hypothetical protein